MFFTRFSLLSGWENGGFSHWCRRGAVGCWRDVRALLHVRVPNPAPLGYDQDQFSTQNWVKTTQRPYPAVSTQHLGWKNNPAFFRVYALKLKLLTCWCGDSQLDLVNCPVGTVLEFLQARFSAGLTQSTLNVYMAAIAAYTTPLLVTSQ